MTFLQFPVPLYCYTDTHLGTAIAIVVPCERGFASGRGDRLTDAISRWRPGATSFPTGTCASNNSRCDRVNPCTTTSSHATRRTAVSRGQRWTPSYSGV